MKTLYDLVSNNKAWASLGGDAGWGYFNFSHTDPTSSNSGIQFLDLMIHDYYNFGKKVLRSNDLKDEKLVTHIREFEKNIPKMATGSGELMEDFIKAGPAKYDLIATYEYYALSNSDNTKTPNKWGNLKIVYLNPTIWSSKPFVVLKGAKSNNKKVEATKKFMDYLLDKEVQEMAMEEGYRPSDPNISDMAILDEKFKISGYKKNVPWSVTEPDVSVIEGIRELSSKISGGNISVK